MNGAYYSRLCWPLTCSFFLFCSLLDAYAENEKTKKSHLGYTFKAAKKKGERLIFTPPGFDKAGVPTTAEKNNSGQLKIVVTDQKTGKPVFCRINVVGPDGNYYEPPNNYLTKYSLKDHWPKHGLGNRAGKAPIRYFGHYFYSWGKANVRVPPGKVRVEVWKGFEYEPVTFETEVAKGEMKPVALQIKHKIPMPKLGYFSGDPHIHITRKEAADTQTILDLMEAEDIHFGSILAYNEPAGPYAGFLNQMDTPQFQGIGKESIQTRGNYSIMSGQEYRSSTYGHLNLFLADGIVLPGEKRNANNWPLYGSIGRQIQKEGGYAFYAHGGYAQAIYADLVQGDVNGVELLQFGVYRGIGLDDWYHILNCGFRFPITGASDFPACRKLGDCKTFVYSPYKQPTFPEWLQGKAQGRSFVSTGPMLLLEVNGKKPGDIIYTKNKSGKYKIRVKANSVVTPILKLQIIANGQIISEKTVTPENKDADGWITLNLDLPLDQSTWIAARAYSLSKLGTPDAESHTNPVYIYFNNRTPFDKQSLDVILEKLDGQMDIHRKRDFQEKARVLDYFQKSRDLLLKIRSDQGMDSTARPALQTGTDIDASDVNISEQSLKNFLKPIPPKTPEESLKTFESANDFTMQIVAAEPLVQDPISAAFDEHGNLYVTEMLDYPYHPGKGKKPIGRVRFLRDTNHDGTYEESHIFAEELLWAGGVAPWDGGVYVAAPPSIWYFKDTDGDFKADIRREVFTGFGEGNQQAMLNNLKFGLDHKIYGVTAGNGGNIKTVRHPNRPEIPLNGRDFRFDPVTEKFETISGTIQFGNSFDDWGNRFLCSQGVPGRHEVLHQEYLERNPSLAVSQVFQVVAPPGLQIYRTSPIEAWRQIRVARRRAQNQKNAGSVGSTHHVIDASAGTTVYRGDAYPNEYYGDLFIGCGQNNLVHRRKLIPNGLSFKTKRMEHRSEFMRSTDIWFRPVNFVNAPDGTLYCLDMAREYLESIHIPLDVVKHLDLTSGRNHGRIYRMAPPNFSYPKILELGFSNNEMLLSAIQSKNGWKRETAHRLIYQKQIRSMIPDLQEIATSSKFPQARLHALWSLQGLDTLDKTILMKALNDSDPRIREHAIKLSEPMLNTHPPLLDRVIELSQDKAPRIRFQVAYSLGESNSPKAVKTLAALAIKNASDHWMRTAILSSVATSSDQLFELLWNNAQFSNSNSGRAILNQLVQVVGSRKKSAEVVHLLSILTEAQKTNRAATAMNLYDGLLKALSATGTHVNSFENLPDNVRQLIKQTINHAGQNALNEKLKPAQRQQAFSRLAAVSYDETESIWTELLQRSLSDPLKITLIKTLGGHSDSRINKQLIAQWQGYSPAVRKEVLQVLLSRETSTLDFLKAAEQKQVSVTAINETRRQLLLTHRNSQIAQLAKTLLSHLKNSPRNQVVQDYQAALKLTGDPSRGLKAFEKTCSACHKIGNQGTNIGPDLLGTLSKDASRLVEHIMDPNRYIQPDYVQYIIVDKNGRTHTGMISEQNVTSLTLKRAKNETQTILRQNIDEIIDTKKSLMPEGLEKNLTKQDLADLITFLKNEKDKLNRIAQQAAARKAKSIGTLPGFRDPNKK